MAGKSLQEWLAHWTAQHPREIVMGLERVRSVWHALGAPAPADRVITVAGTNGKGSTVACLDAMLRADGRRVGRYTSPHLLRYSERIVIAGAEVDEDEICRAFARIEAARGGVPLTWFEAGTLAALLIFSGADLDMAVLEVGLGGRLDAVNIIDADVAVITSIALDHQDILGDTLDAIATEKAGIARRGKPVVVAQADPPAALLAALGDIGARVIRAGVDFQRDEGSDAGAAWTLRFADRRWMLRVPGLAAPVQRRNAAAAVVALQCVPRMSLSDAAVSTGLAGVAIAGRLQRIGAVPETVLDVAHNPEAADALRDWLRLHPRRTRAVFSALADKDAVAIVAALQNDIAHWHVCGLAALSPRGSSGAALAARLDTVLPRSHISVHEDPRAAMVAARAQAAPDERILVFGSFYLVAAVLEAQASLL